MLTTATAVRALANWPAAVTDAMLAPHLGGAARELARRIGTTVYAELAAAEDDDENKAAGAEIEGCLAIAYGIPALHLFALAAGPTIPKAIEDAEFAFLDPDQWEKAAAQWRARAERRLAEWDFTPADAPAPRMYAV